VRERGHSEAGEVAGEAGVGLLLGGDDRGGTGTGKAGHEAVDLAEPAAAGVVIQYQDDQAIQGIPATSAMVTLGVAKSDTVEETFDGPPHAGQMLPRPPRSREH
jgi:hypothetical protein